jgi:hypothetical protein
VSRPPDFDELMDGIERPGDRERLRRVHELLLEAGPPPELSPALATVRAPGPLRFGLGPNPNRRRLAGVFALAGALLATMFGIGYLTGNSDSDESAIPVRETVSLVSNSDASGAVDLGFKGRDGNWSMVVTVRGLDPLRDGDYYTLALTKGGKPVVTCGTFNVADRSRSSVRMSAAYNLAGFDGWVVLHYDAQTHDDTPVLWTKRA